MSRSHVTAAAAAVLAAAAISPRGGVCHGGRRQSRRSDDRNHHDERERHRHRRARRELDLDRPEVHAALRARLVRRPVGHEHEQGTEPHIHALRRVNRRSGRSSRAPLGVAATVNATVSPAGAIQIGRSKPATYFHIGTMTGSWSAWATYPSRDVVPAALCVNLSDEHGPQAKSSGSAKDFSPFANTDNSIQTNECDPAIGGNCTATSSLVDDSSTL